MIALHFGGGTTRRKRKLAEQRTTIDTKRQSIATDPMLNSFQEKKNQDLTCCWLLQSGFIPIRPESPVEIYRQQQLQQRPSNVTNRQIEM